MPLPRDILDSISDDIKEAEAAIADLKEVISDMRLAGLDTSKEEAELDRLTEEVRKLKIFHSRQMLKHK